MDFEVVYEIPPLRAIYSTRINADSARDAEGKIRSNPETASYRIKGINEKKE
jgi:hypothetical protein